MLPPSPAAHAALHIVRTLRDDGCQAYLAGGCVRDLLLGNDLKNSGSPKDYDVATSATPDRIVQLFPRTQQVGAHFGVILVLHDDITTEVATFRHDGAYSDGRRPDAVRFSTDPREDVLRRDFTINGMLLDPFSGEVLDYVGGRADLAAKTIRAIGDPALRFAEDKLRMLRAIRFAARLEFSLEEKTASAMRSYAPEIAQVSNERVRDELTRMLTQGHAARAMRLLRETGLLHEVLPEVEKMLGVEQPPEYHPEGDVWTHTLMLLDHLPAGASPTLAWGMLLHDIGKPATFQHLPGDRIRFNGHPEVGVRIAAHLLNRLRFSNEDATQILALVEHHMRFGDVQRMKLSTLKRFLRLPRFEEHLALHRADASSAHGDLSKYYFAKQHYERMEPEQVRPALLLTGRELIAAGYRPGPRFKAMLEQAEDAQLEGTIHTTAEALTLVLERFGPPT
ncbi:poly(A) polymerase [Granulicella rosea]|uniref:Poly(A) polymerase n=1 Tax=Granulicella rosea TaxID=474952 RepID=A0A239JVF3_9BACT|nr:CCA tRNA nucleotidyltransferase [Granulicella rosea]SNT09363.1 poly(A) polymerase [Granulicella rosea]